MELHNDLVAPCGMYCGVCKRYLATKKGLPKQKGLPHCIGCRPRNKRCASIKGCPAISNGEVEFCYQCANFPCIKLRRSDRRYTTRYRISLISNLLDIKRSGLDKWLKTEEKKWKCPECGGTISVHDQTCYNCGYKAHDIS